MWLIHVVELIINLTVNLITHKFKNVDG